MLVMYEDIDERMRVVLSLPEKLVVQERVIVGKEKERREFYSQGESRLTTEEDSLMRLLIVNWFVVNDT